MDKYCVNCKHSSDKLMVWCGRPGLGVNIVTGEQRLELAAIQRQPPATKLTGDSTVKCGPDGTFWKEKTIEPMSTKPWWKFW